jgi:hypothetical protein
MSPVLRSHFAFRSSAALRNAVTRGVGLSESLARLSHFRFPPSTFVFMSVGSARNQSYVDCNIIAVRRHSQFDVQPKSRNDDRAAVAIVTRIVDVLQIERAEDALVNRNRKIVVPLHDFLRAVRQPAVAELEA